MSKQAASDDSKSEQKKNLLEANDRTPAQELQLADLFEADGDKVNAEKHYRLVAFNDTDEESKELARKHLEENYGQSDPESKEPMEEYTFEDKEREERAVDMFTYDVGDAEHEDDSEPGLLSTMYDSAVSTASIDALIDMLKLANQLEDEGKIVQAQSIDRSVKKALISLKKCLDN